MKQDEKTNMELLCTWCKKPIKIYLHDFKLIGAACKQCAKQNIDPNLVSQTYIYKEEL